MSIIATPAGQTVSYTDHGGTGPVLVLLHSFLMDGRMFDPQVTALGRRYRCITVDERGHGGTPAEAEFTYWNVAEDVLAVLTELGIESAFIAGTSQGGFVALRIAVLAPARVRGLILMGTSAEAEDAPVADAYRGLSAAWVQNGAVDPIIDQVSAICFGDHPQAEWKDRWRGITGEHVSLITQALVDRDSVAGRLGEIKTPVLVLHGENDGAYPVEKAEHIVANTPNAEPLVVVPGGAHFLSITNPDEVNPRIETFLAQHG
jgi:pimeloyl-ACP methyl ester carboxylesterase